MTEPLQTYRFSASGLFTPRYTVFEGDTRLGELAVKRNAFGMISGATYRPEKGEVLEFKRNPGLLRAQFAMWTENREWLASSLRWSFFRRPITIHTGTKPQTVAPLPGWRAGWTLLAPKTGEMARMNAAPFSSSSEIEVYRRLDFELVLFAFFLGSLTKLEFLAPGPVEHRAKEAAVSAS